MVARGATDDNSAQVIPPQAAPEAAPAEAAPAAAAAPAGDPAGLGLLSFIVGSVALGLALVGVVPAAPKEAEKEITNSIGVKLVPVPAGKFTMGSPKNEEDRGDDESLHCVGHVRSPSLRS